MWGKWAQNQNKNQATIIDSEKEFHELLTSLGTEVTNLIFLKMKWYGYFGNFLRIT